MEMHPLDIPAHPRDTQKGSVLIEEGMVHQPFSLSPNRAASAHAERVVLPPEGEPRSGGPSNPKQFGDPTALAVISYLLSLTPTVFMLMGWDGTAPSSFPSMIGAFYFIGGLGMTIGGVFEWVLGNTFPFVVFTTFGGFWFSLGILFDPSKQIAAAFPEGTNTPAFNDAVQFYFIFWVVLCALYFIASLRTNVVFSYLFATIACAFSFLAAGYRQAGLGNPTRALIFLKTAGAFGFANIVGGWYLAAALLFEAVEMPFKLPVGDLSRVLKKRRKAE
ncbi:GPR1/FUN34/yaaH family-domain-containing protein [Mycena latifolia]|nr:GPR1/FUN34/yaaH family-domain-containing protein [Mycena latifolia]